MPLESCHQRRCRSTALVAMLKEEFSYVRRAAVNALGLLPPEALVQHSTALIAMLKDERVCGGLQWTRGARRVPRCDQGEGLLPPSQRRWCSRPPEE